MKFGFVLLFWLLLLRLFSQNCDQVAIPPVRYFEETESGTQEIHTYLIPCSESKTLTVQYPSKAYTGYIDPNRATPPGIIMILLERNPGQRSISVSELESIIYLDANGRPLYFTDPTAPISINQFSGLGNLSNEYVLMPVMVSNINGTDPASWFEEDCVRTFTESALTLFSNPGGAYEFVHFDEIRFVHWPADTSILDFFDFTFTDQETGDVIPYTMTDNRSFRLHFTKPQGIFNFEMSWKDKDCQALEIGVNWSFPVVGISGDTVAGYQNIEKCIPVRAYNFESVTGFEIQVGWDRDSIAYSDIKNIHPDLAPYLTMGNVTGTGSQQNIQVKLPDGLDSLTLPDGAVLFEWCGQPLVYAGRHVQIQFSGQPPGPGTQFRIYGQESNLETHPGGIYVQEDRELTYDLNQLCNTQDDKRRIELDVVNDEAYPYTYSFNSLLVRDSIVDSFPFLIPDVPPGQYEFTIRDSFGFEITETIIVQEDVPADFTMSVDPDRVIQPTCLNPFGGGFALNISPANQNYQLNLLNDRATFTQDSVTGLVAGRYIIEAEDEDGCVDTMTYTLRNPRDIEVTWDDNDMVLCPGEDHISILVKDVHLDPDFTIEFQLNGGDVYVLGDTIHLTRPGNHSLQLWNSDGCTLDTIVSVVSGPDQLSVWDTTSVQILLGDTLTYSTAGHPGLSGLSWSYNNVAIGDGNNVQLIPDVSGHFTFEAEIYDKCWYRDTLLVRVIEPGQDLPDFAFPNAFTPNGDGVNDYFAIIPGQNIRKVISMEVFDRYGNFVFMENYTDDTLSTPQGWNGRHAGVDAPPGIYAVQATIMLFDGREETVGFDVMLIR